MGDLINQRIKIVVCEGASYPLTTVGAEANQRDRTGDLPVRDLARHRLDPDLAVNQEIPITIESIRIREDRIQVLPDLGMGGEQLFCLFLEKRPSFSECYLDVQIGSKFGVSGATDCRQ